MTDLESIASRMLDAYTRAVAAKDVDALMELYDPNVRVFDAWGTWSHEGADAWRRALEGWLTSLGTEQASALFEDTQVVVHGEMALLTTIVTYAGFTAEGEALRSMQNRLTWVMQFEGQKLRIIHEHTSAPIGLEDMQAILQR